MLGEPDVHRRSHCTPLSERKPIYNSLFVQVVAGLVLGIILGMRHPISRFP